MKTIKSVDPMALAKVSAVTGIIMGLIMGVMTVFLQNMLGGTMDSYDMPGAGVATGVVAIIVFPIMYAILGFVSGFVSAIVYNFVASKVGGVKIDLK